MLILFKIFSSFTLFHPFQSLLCAYVGVWPLQKDNSGSIENEELKGFLKDLLELVKKVMKKII